MPQDRSSAEWRSAPAASEERVPRRGQAAAASPLERPTLQPGAPPPRCSTLRHAQPVLWP
eukprot:1157248-Pelagomonas_calceolata.AAC.4